MNAKLNRIVIVWAVPVLAGAVAALMGGHYLRDSISGQARRPAELVPPVRFQAVNLPLPTGSFTFPPGKGSNIANANCVMCHSTGMVLHQPALSADQWKTEIMKMRNAFGAPIPPDQVDELAGYLSVLNGRELETGLSAPGSEGR